jgi:ammonium transporter, Amt family
MAAFSIITFQWYFWAYSLTFSSTGTSGFIGNLEPGKSADTGIAV